MRSKSQDSETHPSVCIYSGIFSKQQKEQHKNRLRDAHCFILTWALIPLCGCSFPAKSETAAPKLLFDCDAFFPNVFFPIRNKNVYHEIAKCIASNSGKINKLQFYINF